MEGRVAPKDIRGKLHARVYRFSREEKREAQTFERFATLVARDLARMGRRLLPDGRAGKRLAAIEGALPDLTLPEDWRAVARVCHELEELGKTISKQAEGWRKRLEKDDDSRLSPA